MRVPVLIQPPPWHLRAALLPDHLWLPSVKRSTNAANDYPRIYCPEPGSVGRGLAGAMERGCSMSERNDMPTGMMDVAGTLCSRGSCIYDYIRDGVAIRRPPRGAALSPFFLSFLDTS